MNNKMKVGIIQAVLAFSLGGSTVVAARLLTENIPLFLCCFLSMGTSLFLLLPLQIREREVLKSLRWRDCKNIILQGFTGMLLFRILTMLGLRFTTAASAGLITSSSPAVMALLSIFILKEKPGTARITAVILTMISLILLNLQNTGEYRFSFIGNLLILLAVLCECLMTLSRKAQVREIPALTNTTVLILSCMIMSLPPALWELRTFSLSGISSQDWLVLFYYGLFPTATGYLLWAGGVVKIPGSMAGITMAATPLTVLILSILVLKEPLLLRHWICGILVILSLILGSREKKRKVLPAAG